MKIVIARPEPSSNLPITPIVIGKLEGNYVIPCEPRDLSPREKELIRLNQSKLLRHSTWATFSILDNQPDSATNDCAKAAVGTYIRERIEI
jgi:hypothetical protein